MLRLEFFAIEKFFTKQSKINFTKTTSFTSKFTNTGNDIKDVLTLSLINE